MIPVASSSPCVTASMLPRRSTRVLVPVILRRTDYNSHLTLWRGVGVEAEVFLWKMIYLLKYLWLHLSHFEQAQWHLVCSMLHHYKERKYPQDTSTFIFIAKSAQNLCDLCIFKLTVSRELANIA